MTMIVVHPIHILHCVKPHSLAIDTGGELAPEGSSLAAAEAALHPAGVSWPAPKAGLTLLLGYSHLHLSGALLCIS